MLTAAILATLVLAITSPVCTADDAQQRLAELRSAPDDWQLLLAGIHFDATVTQRRANGTEETYEYSFDQSSADIWRLDLRRGNRVSLVRNRDFWFCVTEDLDEWRYDRLGFDLQTSYSIGGSLQTQNTLLASATHLLEIPLASFVRLPDVTWEATESPTRPESEHRLRWVLTPLSPGSLMPAFGAIEWVLDNGRPLLTHSEYFPGKRSTETPKGIVVDVFYERQNGRLLPIRSTRVESGITTDTVRGAVQAAQTDPAFYTPAAFGLDRPDKPWQAWQIWMLIAAGAGGISFAIRLRRRRLSSFSKVRIP
jgi:hypothetical protein